MAVAALHPPRASDRRAGSLAVPVVTFSGGTSSRRRDRVATEEPLEIRVAGPGEEPVAVAVTMRTPGHDLELAAGFLAAEGLLGDGIAAIRLCDADGAALGGPSGTGGPGLSSGNVVQVRLHGPLDRSRLRRQVEVSSSCGVCGHTTLEELGGRCAPLPPCPTVEPETLIGLPDRLRERQGLFDRTGGLHAAALFDAEGRLRILREDVGRHNALDKVLGVCHLEHEPTPEAGGAAIAMLSGRASFELVQKAATGGIPIVCAVSAPSSLAVDAAHALGVTLVGFLRDDRFNVYANPERISL